MSANNAADLHGLLVDVKALKSSMDRTLEGTTEDFAKWVSFKNVARSHADLVWRYNQLTGESLSYYDHTKMKGSTDTIWPVMKEIFEGVYAELNLMEGRIKRMQPHHDPTGFDDLLHPRIRRAAIRHYHNGDYRNASLDGATALFDMLREKAGLDMDGEALCNQAFSPSDPIIILSEMVTQSGQNDQRGFMDMFRGFYRGVRNPKAHTLVHDLNATKSAQHLVTASMLARRLDEASIAPGKGG